MSKPSKAAMELAEAISDEMAAGDDPGFWDEPEFAKVARLIDEAVAGLVGAFSEFTEYADDRLSYPRSLRDRVRAEFAEWRPEP